MAADVGVKNKDARNTLLGFLGIAALVLVLLFVQSLATAEDPLRGVAKFNGALTLFAIWGIAAVSLNLINGTLGILSLGHHGFMLIGGYATGLLILSEDARNRILVSGRSTMTERTLGLSVHSWFESLGLDALTTDDTLWLRYLVAIVVGGLVAAFAGLIVGIPSLRLRGDYLAIVTFGFGEIIRLSASTRLFAPLTNGALGFPGVPQRFASDQLLWPFGLLALTVFVMAKLKYSSYGRAMEAIREDEIAAEAMGINLAYHKVLGFVIAAFFAGVAGGLWVSWLGGVRLDFFLFQLTFFFLVAISVGGTGSITGVLLGTALVVFIRQYGDPLEQSYAVSTWAQLVGVVFLIAAGAVIVYRSARRVRPRVHPVVYLLGTAALVAILLGLVAPSFDFWQETFRGFGMRAIFLSVLLIVIMIFRPSGIVGRSEFSWAWVFGERRDQPTEEERAQDAWLTNPELQRRLAGDEENLHSIDGDSKGES
ncbi:MAG: branched-chain amino acid ABC transporter permease [Trueperaceae bacterium]|nr:MAG: branched-chain amino acid ABC transporter permease [Trueperaceae bacterium]